MSPHGLAAAGSPSTRTTSATEPRSWARRDQPPIEGVSGLLGFLAERCPEWRDKNEKQASAAYGKVAERMGEDLPMRTNPAGGKGSLFGFLPAKHT